MICEQKQKVHTEQEWIDLYKSLFPSVAKWIASKGGNLEEARDIFQESLLDYFEKTRQLDHETFKPERPYLMAMVKNKWYTYYSIRKLEQSLEELNTGIHLSFEEDITIADKKILTYLSIAGQKCMDLLSAFYFKKMKMSALAAKFGFSGARSATVQKHKCLEKVKNVIQQKSLTYDDFLG